MSIVVHKEYLPAFGLPDIEDQRPVCRYTILSINEKVGDCAAYEGVGPTSNTPELHEAVRAGGSKISEGDARKLFDEIEDMNLRYRR